MEQYRDPRENTKLDSSTGDDRCHLLIFPAQESVGIDCRTDWIIPTLCRSASFDISSTMLERCSISPSPKVISGRALLWKRLFPERPLPDAYEGAVDDCYGFLSNVLPVGNDDEEVLDRLLREVKGK